MYYEELILNLISKIEILNFCRLFPPTDVLTDGNVKAEEQKSDSSSDSIEGVWRQTIPDVIKDGDVRSTVESILNGAEDVLSSFFTNSGSDLRRVKTKDRKKRVNSSNPVKSNPMTDPTTDCTSASKTDTSTAIASLKSPLFSGQFNNKDFTQWTPLSLPDVQDHKTNQGFISEISSKLTSPHLDSSVKSDDDKNHTKQRGQSSSCMSEQQSFSPDSFHEKFHGSSFLEASPALTFSRKPRTFVYRVQNSESKKMQNVTGMSFHLSYFLYLHISHINNSKFVSHLSLL